MSDREEYDASDRDLGDWEQIEDESSLDREDTLDAGATEDALDAGIVPTERWLGANRFGTTPEEERQGESLDQRLAEEEPDISFDDDADDDEDELTRRGYEAEPRAGRLYAEDEGLGPDEETDAVAFDAGIDNAAATAEEAAVHVVDDPNGVGDGPLR